MYQIFNLTNNPNAKVLDQQGQFTIIEHLRDLSLPMDQVQNGYYASKMGIRKRQVICNVSKGDVTIQAGAMQWMAGDVEANSGIKGVGDLIGKAIRSKVTSETMIKPEYSGSGVVVLEPTYKHLLLMDLKDWNGGVVLEDGMFLACDSSIRHCLSARTTLSSVVAGNEGMFNLSLSGQGVVVVESPVCKEEIVEVLLKDDVLKVDGDYAIAWSSSLKFSVERSAKTLAGSALSQEGLVNVYRGTGKVWLAPL